MRHTVSGAYISWTRESFYSMRRQGNNKICQSLWRFGIDRGIRQVLLTPHVRRLNERFVRRRRSPHRASTPGAMGSWSTVARSEAVKRKGWVAGAFSFKVSGYFVQCQCLQVCRDSTGIRSLSNAAGFVCWLPELQEVVGLRGKSSP